MGYRCERSGAPFTSDFTLGTEEVEGFGLRDCEMISGEREVISNSRCGTGGFKTGLLVIPIIIRRRHVLWIS
jgi:hypothetical protein